MPEFSLNSATTTDFSGTVKSVTLQRESLDEPSTDDARHYFDDADLHLSYYKNIPEISSALHVLSQRVAGLGFEVDPLTKVQLERIFGSGKDTITTLMRKIVEESKVFGDLFFEQIRNEKGTLINLKPLYTGNMVIIYDAKGLLKEYEHIHPKTQKKTLFAPEEIFHVPHHRIGNEMHGTSIVVALKKIIDAKNQALTDEVMLRHRDLALGIAYYDTDDAGKISYANSQIEKAVKKGEMVGLPKGTAEIQPFPNKSPADRIAWLQYLDNLFYQVVGTPKVLVTSEGFTEAGGKAGLLAFEPTEISEKLYLEEQFWAQLGIRIRLKRAPSLLGDAVGTEIKNAGQTGIQANETSVSATRTE